MKINGESRNRWVFVLTVMMGILFFSIDTQAQDTQNNTDSVTYRTETQVQDTQVQDTDTNTDSTSYRSNTTQSTTTVTTSSDVDANEDMDDDDSSEEWARPRAGIKAGVNFSNLMVDDVSSKHGRVGFHAGVYGQLFSSRAFTIQPEVNFSTKGNRIEINNGIIDQENTFNLSYIDIPVLAVFKLGKAAEIHAGAYWAYLVGANIDKDGDISNDFDEVDRDNFDKWDYGLVGGLGFNLGKGAQLGARYNYGLNEIAASRGAKAWLGDAKNSVAQIYLAFNLAAGD